MKKGKWEEDNWNYQEMRKPCLHLNYNQSKTREVESLKIWSKHKSNWQKTTVLIWVWAGMLLWNKVDKWNDKENWSVQAMKRTTTAHLAAKLGSTICPHDVSRSLFWVSSYPLVQGTQDLCFGGSNKTKIFPRV